MLKTNNFKSVHNNKFDLSCQLICKLYQLTSPLSAMLTFFLSKKLYVTIRTYYNNPQLVKFL